MLSRVTILFVIFVLMISISSNVLAQNQTPTPIQCGQIIESETNPNQQAQDFEIKVSAGTTLNGRVEPIGSTFNPVIWFLDSGGNDFASFNAKAAGLAEEFADFVVSSSNPILRVGGVDPRDTTDHSGGSGGAPSPIFGAYNFYGAYTIYLGCTLRDGTTINPGDMTSSGNNNPENKPTPPPFSGTGFPGLAPIDFANAFTNELTLSQPAKSKIPTSGDAVLGYTFDAASNDNLALNFTRLSGNLNLGLVVLSADNKVVFQASLVTSSELTTKFTLPSAGTYTIGIFRIDLLPPDAPEATSFQLTATLNP